VNSGFPLNLHAAATQQPTPKNYRDRRPLAAGQNDARPVPFKTLPFETPPFKTLQFKILQFKILRF
jgi:hypothetical protein